MSAHIELVLPDGTVKRIPAGTTTLDAGHMATDFSPYEGRSVAGRIERVYQRGSLVIAGGELLAERGSGTWLPITSGPVLAAPATDDPER